MQFHWDKLWELFAEAIRAATTAYGPGVVLLVLASVALFAVNQGIWLMYVRSKDQELKRVIDERNRYIEKFVLQGRLSTTPPQSKTLPAKGRGSKKGPKR